MNFYRHPQSGIRIALIVCATLLPAYAGHFVQQGSSLIGTGYVPDASAIVSQGSAVAVSADGNTAIIGGPNDANDLGAAWIFVRTSETWQQQGTKLTGSGAQNTSPYYNNQGYSVAISADGNTALVGAPGDHSGIGAAWIFTRKFGVWTQQGPKLVGTGAQGPAAQGYSVALSADGNTALLGGVGDNNDLGAVWVFVRSGSSWVQQGSKLVGANPANPYSFQGSSVAVSGDGNTALIGGPGQGSDPGAGWVFVRNGGSWSQQGSKLLVSDASGLPAVGFSVALSADGNTALLGGPLDGAPSSGYGTGAAWIFTRSGATWTQQGPKLVGANGIGNESQGQSVSLSADGNTAAVGGPYDYVANTPSGAVWIFGRSGATWTQRGDKLVAPGTPSPSSGNIREGQAVALSGDGFTVLAGGPGEYEGASTGGAWAFATPNVALQISHNGNFTHGQTNAAYTLTVTNSGARSTTSSLVVTDRLPAGLTATSISGSGWNCVLSTLTCTSSAALAPGATASPVTVVVNVSPTAPASVTNSGVSGGGGSNTNSDTDLTLIN